MAVPYARACVASALSEVSVSPFEHGLMLRWHKEGKSTTEIAELLQRGHGTVSRHVRKVSTGKARLGRPHIVTPRHTSSAISSSLALVGLQSTSSSEIAISSS